MPTQPARASHARVETAQALLLNMSATVNATELAVAGTEEVGAAIAEVEVSADMPNQPACA